MNAAFAEICRTGLQQSTVMYCDAEHNEAFTVLQHVAHIMPNGYRCYTY